MPGKSYCIKVLFCLVFSLMLGGCFTKTVAIDKSNSYGDTATTRMPVKRYLEQNETVIRALKKQDVQVIQSGDNLLLVLASDQIFNNRTPILYTNAAATLNNIATLLKGHEKFTVQIAGYTDNVGQPLRDVALSKEQAETIANYLWKRNVDTRFLYAVGYGQRANIADNSAASGRAVNRRIEITLRWLTDAKQG